MDINWPVPSLNRIATFFDVASVEEDISSPFGPPNPFHSLTSDAANAIGPARTAT